MTHYFLKDGKTEIGPLTIEQLKCRPVNKNTPVWFAGLEEWTTVEQVYELKEIFNNKRNSGRLVGFQKASVLQVNPTTNYTNIIK